MPDNLKKANRSLNGLSTGDAFGEQFLARIPKKVPAPLPLGEWYWTDDTHMALSIVEILEKYGRIEQDALADAFSRRFQEESWRGYGGGAVHLLQEISRGGDWRVLSPAQFGGGSYGNGAAMRVAPVGAFFCSDLQRAAEEAKLSAVVTHAHPEGQAGAIAVAVAAALAAGRPDLAGREFLREVVGCVPQSETRARIEKAVEIPESEFLQAVITLGTGAEISAQDTVPFCLWSAAYHLDSFEDALWQTVRGGGDSDTTCAIVGGIVALSAKTPPEWLEHREPLPAL